MNKIMRTLFLLMPLALLLFGLKREEGCPAAGKAVGCYGPEGHYWTVWEAQLEFQIPALGIALSLAGTVFLLDIFRKWTGVTIFTIALGILLWAFLVCVIFHPIRIHY